MGLLEQLGISSGKSDDDTTYQLSTDRYAAAFSVAVPRAELEAYLELIERDAETPYTDDETALEEALDDVLDDSLTATEWVDQMEQPRNNATPVIDTWNEQISNDVDVVYFLPGTHERLLAFLGHCRSRDEDATDPFTLPSTINRAASVVKRVDEATQRDQSRVFVSSTLVPDVSGLSGQP